MLQKWKNILANWINCYFKDEGEKSFPITIESLVNIISHLRENFNLDESKSSILDAHTIQEFILEKYPAFTFENGNLEPLNEEEIYLAASLLLYFVCVNSKDMDLKKAMCSKLSAADQEIILKFSKSLMDCPNISSTDVLSAITESCGQDIAGSDIALSTVAETPPVLRSLHIEVRRLKAALDAERFDRNYLQEELARTTLKMENLMKDKDQHKQEIVNLKAKLSTCGSENCEQDTEVSTNNSIKLVKQLEQTEQRLVAIQEKLDDVQYERDMYKSKIDELKRERDKWFTTSQEESSRACQLAEELDMEREQVHSLKELVSELRQHNRLNGLDTSQLECDDLDQTIPTLQNNISVCSEACANIIEVQLGEERAKIVLLQQQMEILQEQLNDLNRKSEEECINLSKIISEKDTDIFNLKHRINEEIEEKNNLKSYYDNEVTRLNNEVIEFEQRLRGNGENARRIIDSKLREIQILQEEKLSLLQSLSNETSKHENIIHNLKSDLDAEKSSRFKLKEDFETKVMKLNEKILNRNNELVEMQNKLFNKGESIEQLQFELRKEKELKGEFINKYNNDIMNLNSKIQAYENELKQKNDEISNLKQQIQDCNSYSKQLEEEMENLRSCIATYQDNNRILEESKSKLLIDIQNRDLEIDNIHRDNEHLQNRYCDEKNTLQYNLDEINATVEALRSQLQNEIQYKVSIQNELHQYKLSNEKQIKDIQNLNEQITELKSICNETERSLLNQTKANSELKENCADLNIQVEESKKDLSEKELKIKRIQESLDETKHKFDKECQEKENMIDLMKMKLTTEMENIKGLEKNLDVLQTERNNLMKEINDKHDIIIKLQNDVVKLSNKIQENEIAIDKYKVIDNQKTKEIIEIKKTFDVETTKLMIKLNEMDKQLKELRIKSSNAIEAKELQIETLKLNIDKLQTSLQQEHEKSFVIEKEKLLLIQQLNDSNSFKAKCEKEYLNKCTLLNSMRTQLHEEILRKNTEINDLKQKLENLEKCNEDKNEEIEILNNNVDQAVKNSKDITLKKDLEIGLLSEKIKHLDSLIAQSKKELKAVIDNNSQVMEVLQRENVQLHYTIEEDNSNHELLIKEKDSMIETLEKKLKNLTNDFKLLQKDYENDKFVWENLKTDLQGEINSKVVEISEVTNKLTTSEMKTHDLEGIVGILTKEKTELIAQVDSLRKTCTESAVTNDKLKATLLAEKTIKDILENEKENVIKEKEHLFQKIAANECAYKTITSEKDSLLNEKAILIQELMEEKSVRKITDQSKEALLVENEQINNQLQEVSSINSVLVQEKECLTQQLVEERLSKDLAEQEKLNLINEKMMLENKLKAQIYLKDDVEKTNVGLLQEVEHLVTELKNEKRLKEDIEKDFTNVKQEVEKFSKENSSLNLYLSVVKKDLLDLKSNVDLLTNENVVLKTEKELLTKSCADMRLSLDDLMSQKLDLSEKISDLNKKLDIEIANKNEQIQNLSNNYNKLISDYNVSQNENENFRTTLNSGIQKVFDNLKKDNICEEIVHQYNYNLIENASVLDKCDIVFKIINNFYSELILRKNLENALEKENNTIKELWEIIKQKEILVQQLEDKIKSLEKNINDFQSELLKQNETHNSVLETKARDIQQLQLENQTLRNELNGVKVQLDVKVHSLKDKLIDNENLTDKLKKTYECQIDNLNMMITKLTNYLKEKTAEFDSLRNENDRLRHLVEDNNASIKVLEEDLKIQKQNQEKLINDFESERLVLKNMVTVTESVMEDQKISLNKIIADNTKCNQSLQEDLKMLRQTIDNERKDAETKLQEKKTAFETAFKELTDVRKEKEILEKEFTSEKQFFENKISLILQELSLATRKIETLTTENQNLHLKCIEQKEGIVLLEEKNDESKIKYDAMQVEFDDKVNKLQNDLDYQNKCRSELDILLKSKEKENSELLEEIMRFKLEIANLEKNKSEIKLERDQHSKSVEELKATVEKLNSINENMKSKIVELEHNLELEMVKLEEYAKEKLNLTNKCLIYEEYQAKAEIELEMRQKEINGLKEEIKMLKTNMEEKLKERDKIMSILKEEQDSIVTKLNKELMQEKECLESIKIETELKDAAILILRKKVDGIKEEDETVTISEIENDKLEKAEQREKFAVSSQDMLYSENPRQIEQRDLHHQVDSNKVNTSTDNSSMEIYRTVSDLETIIQDKNRTITTLNSDITYLKTLLAESENKCLDISRDLELSQDNCQQLSNQLKKVVQQKNEEIMDLKKQITKMSATENRATQIIKVSAKYQAIILKRIAEIKSNTVLKELTNFGNSNCDNDLRRGLTAGTITMDDLENFLETTERHIRRCSEKQITLQKERDRLSEVNRINESEIINLRKFLTEMSVSVKTFNSVKELYTQKMSAVVSLQRTVRREILALDSQITDAAMGKLERGYSAIMQDFCECAMNLERWMERCISRTISSEKIKQAFTTDIERSSLAASSFQNAALEIQLDELQSSFNKLLEEVACAKKGEGAKDAQSLTVMEVRAEYEDKLNRMKTKMKELYQEQIKLFKEKQQEEIMGLELELEKTRMKLQDCEQHIKSLTNELWKVGEKYLMKKDEADWLRKNHQRSGSLMSLQHVHSSGLVPPQEEVSRPSDTHSLRSLPVHNNNNNTKEGRGLHMSDEEGEVFDNRWLRELANTPRREREAPPGHRISELRWRNSLCPPHLKSSYPAETQFAPAVQEDDIKCMGGTMSLGGKQRKEVGITAYKKPGPPTPSKQAGRLSATDSELRESLRIEADPAASRKTSTPSRIRSLFRSSKNDTTEGTPRSRRLSSIFRKK